MKHGFRRTVATFSLAALGSVIAAAPANAATPTGVGSSVGRISLVSVDYGSLLKATLIGEQNRDTIDPVNGVPTATETLSPLVAQSTLLGDLSLPSHESTTTGDANQTDVALVDLADLNVPGVSGAINPATLKSVVDADGAASSLTATLTNLNVLGAAGVDSAGINLGGLAGPLASAGTRTVTANAISVLNLQALLNLLGLDISMLPLDQVADLLDQLSEVDIVNTVLGNTSFGGASDITDALAAANADIIAKQATQTTATAAQTAAQAAVNLCAPACPQPVLDALAAATAALTTATNAVNAALADQTSLIDALFGVLAGTPLLAVNGVTVGALAAAKDTEANSSAIAGGQINDIRVGGLDLGAVDINATLDQVQAVVTSATATINGVLGSIDPSLANLLSIKLLDRATQISTSGDYINALAAITAVDITVTPPDICALFQNVTGEINILPQTVTLPDNPVHDVLAQLGSGVPGCLLRAEEFQPQAIGETDLAALTGPINFKVATVASGANFKVAAATPETPATPELPRTGMNETLLLVIGGLMAAAALGLRRVTATARATHQKR